MNNAVFKDFIIFAKKTWLEFLFNKVAGFEACNFILKRLQHGCFPVNIAKCKIFENTYFEQHLRTAVSAVTASFSIQLFSRITLADGFFLFNE